MPVKTKFYGDAFVVFHHINAYEENGHVVFDLITYKDSSLYDMFYIENMKKEVEETDKSFPVPVSQRFVIPINADLKVSVEEVCVFILQSVKPLLF